MGFGNVLEKEGVNPDNKGKEVTPCPVCEQPASMQHSKMAWCKEDECTIFSFNPEKSKFYDD